jgi:hypothetical protein
MTVEHFFVTKSAVEVHRNRTLLTYPEIKGNISVVIDIPASYSVDPTFESQYGGRLY